MQEQLARKQIRQAKAARLPSAESLLLGHADVLKGATIKLEMSNTPNLSLGAEAADFPSSAMEIDPKEFE
jgi:putative alpha-1,2-mannosidase